MWKKGFLLFLMLAQGVILKAQNVNSFKVENNAEFDKIKFSLTAADGTCKIGAGQGKDVMELESKTEQGNIPDYRESIVNRTKEVSVSLPEGNKSTLASSLSKSMFGAQTDDDYTWKVYLSKIKPMDLNLNYAIGDTYIDLSDLPVERLKMKSGSANIKVNYDQGKGNQVKMDTFMIRVDMGSFDAKNLYLCNSDKIIADVGFGKVRMDFANAREMNANVKATVCAGRLEVLLPENAVPVKINIHDSPLCHVRIPNGFEKVSNSVFVSPGFDPNLTDFVSFDVDVAFGNVVFK